MPFKSRVPGLFIRKRALNICQNSPIYVCKIVLYIAKEPNIAIGAVQVSRVGSLYPQKSPKYLPKKTYISAKKSYTSETDAYINVQKRQIYFQNSTNKAMSAVQISWPGSFGPQKSPRFLPKSPIYPQRVSFHTSVPCKSRGPGLLLHKRAVGFCQRALYFLKVPLNIHHCRASLAAQGTVSAKYCQGVYIGRVRERQCVCVCV